MVPRPLIFQQHTSGKLLSSRHSLYYHLNRIKTKSLNLLFPPQCVGCKRIGSWFCATCAQAVAPVGDAICEQCGRPQAASISRCGSCQQTIDLPLRMIRAAAYYGSPLREAIHALKYDNRPELGEILARYLIATLINSPWRNNYLTVDAVIPVPLHTERFHARGYNQSELLASALCYGVQLPLQVKWLERKRDTLSQVTLNQQERQTNMVDAFIAHSAVRGKSLLLIDDVYTTGATLRACASAALDAGAVAVYGLTLACPI